MDQVKTGKFIAELRREKGMTQEMMGKKLGVTNKTVSHWENGNYMPDIEMFQELSELFGVSINELLSGCRLSENEFREEADKNIVDISKAAAFSYKEQTAFWKRKWLKEHIFLIALWLVSFAAFCLYAYGKGNIFLVSLTPLAAVGIYCGLRNQMMGYVEEKVFDPPEKRGVDQ